MAIEPIKAPIFSTKESGVLCFRGVSSFRITCKLNSLKYEGSKADLTSLRDLGLTATEVGKYLGLSKSAVSRAANRGQKLIVDQFLSLKD